MAGLQRSAVSFRRQGSSGLVWDDRFISEELNQADNKPKEEGQGEVNLNRQQDEEETSRDQEEPKPASRTVNRPPSIELERSRSNGGGPPGYRTGRVPPAVEPPSPKVSACGFCGAFGHQKKQPRNSQNRARAKRPGQRRSR